MWAFVVTIAVVSLAGVSSDVVILGHLIAGRERPVRVWGRLFALAYHAGVTAWAVAVLTGY
jgi:hypothetical protein